MEENKDPTFIIMGQKIVLISDECAYGLNTVADMGDFFYPMGNEYPTISTAIFAWQESNNRFLSNEELKQVMIENGIIEGDTNACQENKEDDYEEITDEDIIEETLIQEGSKKSN